MVNYSIQQTERTRWNIFQQKPFWVVGWNVGYLNKKYLFYIFFFLHGTSIKIFRPFRFHFFFLNKFHLTFIKMELKMRREKNPWKTERRNILNVTLTTINFQCNSNTDYLIVYHFFYLLRIREWELKKKNFENFSEINYSLTWFACGFPTCKIKWNSIQSDAVFYEIGFIYAFLWNRLEKKNIIKTKSDWSLFKLNHITCEQKYEHSNEKSEWWKEIKSERVTKQDKTDYQLKLSVWSILKWQNIATFNSLRPECNLSLVFRRSC